VERIAAGLITRNLSLDRPIAILSGNSIEHLLLSLAAAWAGIPYCPISPAYSQASSDLQKLRSAFELLTPGLVAAFDTQAFERALGTVVPADVEMLGNVPLAAARTVTLLDALETSPSSELDAAHARTGPDSVVKFLLTSGSTGEPKAVITTQRMLCSNARMQLEALPFLASEPPVMLDWLPWNHTFGGSHNVGLALFNGGSLYIDDGKPTPAGFAQTLANLREVAPTVYFNVPKGFEMLSQGLAKDSDLRRTFYSRLQAYFFAGAALSQHTWDALDSLSLQERGMRVPMLSGLGATETGPSVTFTTPRSQRSGVIGLPAAGNVIKLAPVGEKLELRVRSPSVTPGYWRRPELTAAAFDEEGFYRLGDAVRLIDAADATHGLAFDGRIAEDFKLASGTWVSVGPLRASLTAALAPLVQDVVIAGLNSDFLTALLIPDLRACASILGLDDEPTHAKLAAHPAMLKLLRERLSTHAGNQRGSSTRVERAMLLSSPPSLDRGEITDKGSINQRAVLSHRAEDVAMMYAAEPPSSVACV
jgi:feruloyl-CoA synthase